MAKLGVTTNGISQEFEYALGVMREFGLRHAELQYLWGKEVGDLDDAEIARAQNLVAQSGVEVCCISRHIFAGLLIGATEVGDVTHNSHLASLRRCIDMAKAFNCGLVRIMSFRKEMILFGSGGAEFWNVSKGAWEKLKLLLAPALQLAEDQAIDLVIETGNNGMINSAWLARKLLDELGSKRLKILWDPANSLYSNESPYPDAYEALRGGFLGHIHMKDCRVDIPKARVDQCRLGDGHMAPYLEKISDALRRDSYQGVVVLECVYRPEGKTFEDGFRESVGKFKHVFG